MTDAEAADLWCPVAVVMQTTGGSGNRSAGGDPAEGSYCLGTRCAQWDHEKKRPGCGGAGQPPVL